MKRITSIFFPLLMLNELLLCHGVQVTNIILIGATGDLAKKYLWQGIFNLYLEEESDDHHFNIFSGARVETKKGANLVERILNEQLSCPPGNVDCDDLKSDFIKSVVYHQLKQEDDYVKLCAVMNYDLGTYCSDTRDRSGQYCYKDSETMEGGRLFYLSIPPFAYAETAKFIDRHCRPKSSSSWLRVVLEKPFGHDKSSAEELAVELQKYLRENDMYRVDHYLGKTISMEILNFRKQNKYTYENRWNKYGIDQVDIVMSETNDAKGRTLFYDEYGVIRDVMQNHLTELLVLITMEMPDDLNDVAEVQRKKLDLMKSIQVILPQQVVTGQYVDYNGHVQEDFEDPLRTSKKATFSAANVKIFNSRWNGVQFHLVSGKKLNQRASYVKITFRNQNWCISGGCSDLTAEPKVIIFNIGHGDVGVPSIAVTKSLKEPVINWSKYALKEKLIFGLSSEMFNIYVPPRNHDAYTSLINAVYHGNHDLFVGTESLMASWDIWTPVVQYFDSIEPRVYAGGDDINNLDYFVDDDGLHFLDDDSRDSSIEPGLFRDQFLVHGNGMDVSNHLANDILLSAITSVANKGVFHLALSGGNTPKMVFRNLIHLSHKFPWQHTHIWMVDERCVPFSDRQSNFRMINDNLLKYIHIPYLNVHPMPVELGGGICNERDGGEMLYEASMKSLLTHFMFDFVLLGVGSDGHTASLFPNAVNPTDSEKLVTFVSGSPNPSTGNRMSLTFSAINRSQNIAILILGESKRDIVRVLNKGSNDPTLYPVTGVVPESGELYWYIDDDALS